MIQLVLWLINISHVKCAHTVDFPKVGHVAMMFTIDTHSIGTSCVSKFLRDNCTLKVLSMNDNAVGDNGVSVIMDGLKCNSSLTELWLPCIVR